MIDCVLIYGANSGARGGGVVGLAEGDDGKVQSHDIDAGQVEGGDWRKSAPLGRFVAVPADLGGLGRAGEPII